LKNYITISQQMQRSSLLDNFMSTENIFDIQLRYMIPIIVGCTSDIITDTVIAEMRIIGFKDMFNVPLSPNTIKNTIIPYLNVRDTFIKSQNLKECINKLTEDDQISYPPTT